MGFKDALQRGKNSVASGLDQAKQTTGELVERAMPPAKQAGEAAVEAARKGAESVHAATKEFLSTPRGNKIAGGAAIGGALGVPLPILGPITGALVGGAIVWWAGLREAKDLAALESRCRALTPSERKNELATLEQLHLDGRISEKQYVEVRRALTGL